MSERFISADGILVSEGNNKVPLYAVLNQLNDRLTLLESTKASGAKPEPHYPPIRCDQCGFTYCCEPSEHAKYCKPTPVEQIMNERVVDHDDCVKLATQLIEAEYAKDQVGVEEEILRAITNDLAHTRKAIKKFGDMDDASPHGTFGPVPDWRKAVREILGRHLTRLSPQDMAVGELCEAARELLDHEWIVSPSWGPHEKWGKATERLRAALSNISQTKVCDETARVETLTAEVDLLEKILKKAIWYVDRGGLSTVAVELCEEAGFDSTNTLRASSEGEHGKREEK